MASAPIQMGSPLSRAIIEIAEQAGTQGIAMGALVDVLQGRGFAPEDVEHEVWTMLAGRRLTPSGFVCRSLRKRGRPDPERVYEFLLVPWSPELDGQLELDLDDK